MSLKDEQLALKPPFKMDGGYKYRDGSGTYACPHCHYKLGASVRIHHGDTQCPGCNAELIWDEQRH